MIAAVEFIQALLELKIQTKRGGETHLWIVLTALAIPLMTALQVRRQIKRRREIDSVSIASLKRMKVLTASASYSAEDSSTVNVTAKVVLQPNGSYLVTLETSRHGTSELTKRTLRNWEEVSSFLAKTSILRATDLNEA
jgi:hypothetical protein